MVGARRRIFFSKGEMDYGTKRRRADIKIGKSAD